MLGPSQGSDVFGKESGPSGASMSVQLACAFLLGLALAGKLNRFLWKQRHWFCWATGWSNMQHQYESMDPRLCSIAIMVCILVPTFFGSKQAFVAKHSCSADCNKGTRVVKWKGKVQGCMIHVFCRMMSDAFFLVLNCPWNFACPGEENAYSCDVLAVINDW